MASNRAGIAQTVPQSGSAPTQSSAGSASADGKLAAKLEPAEGGKAEGSDAARKKLLADTHMLLSLSRELQAEAAKSTANTISLRMIRKSEEIQRLAAVVRAEMAKPQ